MSSHDDLAIIDGIAPNKYLKDGEQCEAKSHSSNAVYKVKRAFDHYYCTCPAWRNQSRAPVNARTCKHLRSILGDDYENARIKHMNPDGAASSLKSTNAAAAASMPTCRATRRGATTTASTTSKNKRKKQLEEEEDDNSETKKRPRSRSERKPVSQTKQDVEQGEEREEEEEDEEDDEEVHRGKANVNVLLAVKWDLEKGSDPTGWWVSEKLDGVRVFWDGKRMLSRLGNPFTPPEWFTECLPKDVTLDGELFGGRGQFQSTVSIVKTPNTPRWQEITFQVFDVPSMKDRPFEERFDWLKSTFSKVVGGHKFTHVSVVEHLRALSKDHVLAMLKEVEQEGGEGLMLRKPGSLYEGNRSSTLQKIKSFYDAEARVTGYVPGKGKNRGMMGALKCVMASGKIFNVGTGFSDKQRGNPPKIGNIITYRFQELTNDGVPRFPSYIGEAIDKDEPTDAVMPFTRK